MSNPAELDLLELDLTDPALHAEHDLRGVAASEDA